MANHTVTGGLGSGKSIMASGRIRDFMLAGRPVAGNMDFYPENILPPTNKSIYLRLPDFPSSDELWLLGKATDSNNEKLYGLLVLDELAVFLNSRDWARGDREEFIAYLRHSRKQHWHTLFITQDIESLDKQARVALIEHKVVCSRMDRIPIPIIGTFFKLFGLRLLLPKVHIGIVRYGAGQHAMKVDTWTYHGKSLYSAYNTDQVFTDDEEREITLVGYTVVKNHKRSFFNRSYFVRKNFDIQAQVTGMYSQLSAWHLKGRYMTWYDRYRRFFLAVGFLLFVFFAGFIYFFAPKPELKEQGVSTVVQQLKSIEFGSNVDSYYKADGIFHLKLEDGTYRISTVVQFNGSSSYRFLSRNKWHLFYL